MDSNFKENFLSKWEKYFPKAELPITFYYSDNEKTAPLYKTKKGEHCLIDSLKQVRKGKSASFSSSSLPCGGSQRYLGFSEGLRPGFEYFLSCGIPGKMEGERYKKSPELVKELMKNNPEFKAKGKYLVAKRWDKLVDADNPEIVVFFGHADILSGLFTLTNFDESEPNGVYAPFCAGCGSIVGYPYKELQSSRPRGVLGMFDVSARPFVEPALLSFAVPMDKFKRMVGNMDESFLITNSWEKVRNRITTRRI
jgi:hypothetical protein